MVAGARGEGVAVGGKSQCCHMSGRFQPSQQRIAVFFHIHAPQHDGAVERASCKGVAVGGEGHAPDPVGMPLEGVQQGIVLRRVGVPQARCGVARPGSEGVAIGGKGHAPHIALCFLKNVEQDTIADPPEAHGSIPPARSKRCAVGGKSHAAHSRAVSAQGVQQRAIAHPPEPRGGVVAARGEDLVEGRVGHATRPVGVAFEGANQPAITHSPHAHAPIAAGSSEGLPVGCTGNSRCQRASVAPERPLHSRRGGGRFGSSRRRGRGRGRYDNGLFCVGRGCLCLPRCKKRVAHGGGALDTVVWLERKCPHEQVVHRGRNTRQRLQRVILAKQHCGSAGHCINRRLGVGGAFACEEVVHCCGQAVEIATGRGARALDLFEGSIGERVAADAGSAGGLVLLRGGEFGKAKVEQDDFALGGELQIVGLDIAVDNGRRAGVEVVQHFEHLVGPVERLFKREGGTVLAQVFFEQAGKVIAVDEIHHQKLSAGVGEVVGHPREGGVVEEVEQACFALERFVEGGCLPRGGGGDGLLLQCNRAAECLVYCLVDCPHASLPDEAHNLIAIV